jgi:hypothetical protein
MGKPTETELKTALAKASEMREHGADRYFLAKSLLNMNYRINLLEKVLHFSELYIKTGNGTHEHSMLVKSIENYHISDHRSAGEDEESFGL